MPRGCAAEAKERQLGEVFISTQRRLLSGLLLRLLPPLRQKVRKNIIKKGAGRTLYNIINHTMEIN